MDSAKTAVFFLCYSDLHLSAINIKVPCSYK